MTEDIEIERGTENVFKDLGEPNADILYLKAELATQIIGVLNKMKLKGKKAAATLNMSEPDISRIRNADLARFTVDRLIEAVNSLGLQVEINVTKAA